MSESAISALTNYNERKSLDRLNIIWIPSAVRAATSKVSQVKIRVLIHHQRQTVKEDG